MARDKQKADVQENERDVPYYKSDLEDIDMAVFKFFDKKLDISTRTNKGFASVPVIWAGQERSNNVKRDDIKRDKKGNVVYPVIVIERTNIVKDLQAAKSFPHAAVDPRRELSRFSASFFGYQYNHSVPFGLKASCSIPTLGSSFQNRNYLEREYRTFGYQ